ncbi:L,D-transpeptidase [Mollicutes bacterium LVI A0078]|nr:L,D-transpeptidase [Mollicutes bacterium LVI A0075]WOO90611.1 L,D-transpeptidase [Mollicutes bacterium LVI A0078]
MKKIIISIVLTLVITYIVGIGLFSFFVAPNTYVGDLSLSMINFNDLEQKVTEQFETKTIKIDDVKITNYEEKLTSLGASVDSQKLYQDIKTNQTAYKWPFEIAAKSTFELKDYVSVDDKVLTNQLTEANFFETEGRTAAKDAYLELNNETNTYDVVPATEGTIIDKKLFVSAVSKAIVDLEPSISTEKYYKVAANDTDKLQADADKLNERINRYVAMKIGDDELEVDKETLASSLYIDDNGDVAVDSSILYWYLYDLSLEYDSAEVGAGYRTVTESNVDPAYEEIVAGLISDENVDVIGEAPIEDDHETFKQKAKTDASTYIEVNIGQQLMWVYKDDELLVQTPVVTGSAADGWDTPVGEYTIIDKETDKVLNGSTVGFDYKVPVNYWMRLTNSGIGIHDIDWLDTSNAWDSRSVYELQGSHGCINVPNDVMSTVYNNIPVGTPVYVTA